MASVYNRGTRAKPRWYASVKLLDGAWRAYPTYGNSKEEAQTRANEMQQRADRGLPVIARTEKRATVGELMTGEGMWLASLSNRNAADDRRRACKHLVPAFAESTMPEMTMARVVAWLDDLKSLTGEARISSATQRHCFNLLSRFFSWAIERGHGDANPCRLLPARARPSTAAETRRTWIEDERTARAIFHALPYPLDLVFLTGYISGLRPGEVCGLRMSDCAWLDEEDPEARVLRVRHNRLGPLKEDKTGGGLVKWAVTSDDLIAQLAPHLARRQAQGAQGDDLVFATNEGGVISRQRLQRAWATLTLPQDEGGKGLTLPAGLDWYGATRHSYVTRQIAAGADTEVVSASVGHADVRVTKKHYSHVVVKKFPASMRRGLGVMPGEPAPVLPLKRAAG
jgi:integrase